MTFVYKEERKFGASKQLGTKAQVGPGAYLGPESTLGTKKRISIKQPFEVQVNRDGKNSVSWANLNEAKMQQ